MASKLRQLQRISYFEPEEPSFDEYIYCPGCRDYVYDMCPQHGPLLILPDTKVPKVTNYPPYVPRAALTIPKAFLHIARSYIPGAGLGVFSSVTLPNGVRFGPYRGVVKKYSDSSYCWQIFDKNNKPSHVVDGGDGHRSNWMRFINCSRNWNEQNLIAFQYKGQIYYRTIKIIPRNTELLVYYGGEAAHGLGIDLKFYNCQPRITEMPSTSQKAVEKKIDTDELKIGSDGNLSKKSEKITNNNIAAERESTLNTLEKVKESSTLSIDDKLDNHKSVIPIVSSTQKIFSELTPSTKENTKKSSNLYEDNVQDYTTKKTLEINNNSDNAPNTQKNFTCDKCKKSFSTKKLLKKHIVEENRIHHIGNTNIKEKPSEIDFFYCDICKFKTKLKRSIELHLKLHAAKKVYTCHECEYRSMYLNQFKIHTRTHTGEKPYSCNLCKYACKVKSDLKKHIRTHTGEKPYSCHLCKYACKVKSNLKKHIRTHTGEKPYSCHLCKYTCKQKGSLKTHIRTHTGEKPYSCHLCKYTCKQKGSLKTHIRTHTGEKPYSCHLCKYTCKVKGSLKTHIRTHTGEKPYSCNFCKYTCTQKSDLKTHIRTHTGEKPYSCHLCKYACKVKSNLKKHIRTHTGEKPYSCHLCKYTCKVKGSLKTHVKTHTDAKL